MSDSSSFCLIILCPLWKEDTPENNQAFKNSAENIKNYFSKIVMSPEHILNLIDVDDNSITICDKIRIFLSSMQDNGISSLIFYFVGHGFLRPLPADAIDYKGSDYCWVLKNTNPDNIETLFPVEYLQNLIEGTHNFRTWLIIDCCFAKRVESILKFSYQFSGSVTALFSSDSCSNSSFDTDRKSTVFSKKLLDIFENGILNNENPELSFEDIGTEILDKNYTKDTLYKDIRGVKPSQIRIFPNPRIFSYEKYNNSPDNVFDFWEMAPHRYSAFIISHPTGTLQWNDFQETAADFSKILSYFISYNSNIDTVIKNPSLLIFVIDLPTNSSDSLYYKLAFWNFQILRSVFSILSFSCTKGHDFPSLLLNDNIWKNYDSSNLNDRGKKITAWSIMARSIFVAVRGLDKNIFDTIQEQNNIQRVSKNINHIFHSSHFSDKLQPDLNFNSLDNYNKIIQRKPFNFLPDKEYNKKLDEILKLSTNSSVKYSKNGEISYATEEQGFGIYASIEPSFELSTDPALSSFNVRYWAAINKKYLDHINSNQEIDKIEKEKDSICRRDEVMYAIPSDSNTTKGYDWEFIRLYMATLDKLNHNKKSENVEYFAKCSINILSIPEFLNTPKYFHIFDTEATNG